MLTIYVMRIVSLIIAVFLIGMPAAPAIQAAGATTAKAKYYEAEGYHRQLRHSAGMRKYRNNWRRGIALFEGVYQHDPSGPWAAAGLYMAGVLYIELYGYSGKSADRQEALDLFSRIVKRFPRSRYAAKAKAEIKRVAPVAKPRVAVKKSLKKRTYQGARAKPPTALAPVVESKPATQPPAPVGKAAVAGHVNALRVWSNPKYSRVVVDLDRPTRYIHNLLARDPKLNKPQRLYIDLADTRLDKDIRHEIPINNKLLIEARAGQYRPDVVRIVIDIKSFERYKVFKLNNPFRIVVDVWGEAMPAAQPKADATKHIAPKNSKMPSGALAKQLALGVKTIVIDAGHGGKDYGAPGYLKGVHEKHVVLSIAKRLARLIRKEIGCNVILTRSNDRYLTLEERTAIANTREADLFISIHTNAAKNSKAYGIETYYLNLATDAEAIRVAARENATSTKNISDLDSILSDLMQNAKVDESSRLAECIQDAMYGKLKKSYSSIKNKGVKQAPFYVLLGAQMPAVLIETAFISNPRECKRLTSPAYQDRLCRAIVSGIETYIKSLHPYG